MKIFCVFGRYQYGRAELGEGIEYSSFIPALTRLGHEVIHIESWDRALYRSYAGLNAALLQRVCREMPSVLIAVQRDCEIWTETLDCISELGSTVTVAWTTDDSWKYGEVSRFIGNHYDVINTTYAHTLPWYRRDGIQSVHLTQWAANSHWLQPPRAARDCRYQVSFVGAAYGRRRQAIKRLAAHGISVHCFGDGWPEGPVPTERIPEIMRDSIVSLNFSDGFKGKRRQLKARTFEIPGAGGMLVTEHAPGVEQFYAPGSEILVSNSSLDMIDKIRSVLQDHQLRDRIAIAGYSRTAKDHTYELRMQHLLEFALNSGRRANPHPVVFEEALLRHALSPAARWTSRIAIVCCQKLWGRERGRRAARRAVFEFSRRVLGERTFSAAGLPGRLFPEI